MKVSKEELIIMMEALDLHHTKTLHESLQQGDSETIMNLKLYPTEKLMRKIEQEILGW